MIEYLDYCQTDAQREAVKALHEHGSQRKAGKALGVSKNAIAQRIDAVKAHAAKRGYSPEHGLNHPTPDGFVLKGYSDMRTNDEGKPIWHKVDRDKERQLELIEQYVEKRCKEIIPHKKIAAPRSTNKPLMSVYPWGDPHYGMYSWAAETGADFDVDIALRDMYGAMDYLVDRSPPSEKGLIINTGDYFHAENMEGITTRSGHILDMDTRFPNMLDVGLEAMERCIVRALEKHKIVEVVNVPGNHDETMAHFMSTHFARLFRNNPRVKIHKAPTQRHYVRHGKVLIGAVHGHQTKDRDLPGIMATERPEDWGQTRHRYYFRGHHHHDTRVEYNGCIVEQVRTLAAGDAYAVGGGYLSGRDMKCIVMHEEYGEQSRFTCGIDVLRRA